MPEHGHTVSNTYTVAQLFTHPLTKPILLNKLKPLNLDHRQLANLNATPYHMAATNMGGGIPYDIMAALTRELDKLPYPLPSWKLYNNGKGPLKR